MATMSFRDAMAGFSDVLYARAMEKMADKRRLLLDLPGSTRANAHSSMTFDVTLDKGGTANLSVGRYFAGYALRTTVWIEAPNAAPVMSGYIHSSDGGGTEFANVRTGRRLQFELNTSFWRATTLSLFLRTTPALPEGTALKVHMDIDY